MGLPMSNSDFGAFTLLLLVLVGAAHLLGHLFTRLRQPRVVGEILAGIVVGPAVLGQIAPAISARIFSSDVAQLDDQNRIVLGFLYNLGLLFLMFASGAETKGLFRRRDRREVAWLGIVGTGMPFVLTLLVAPFLPLGRLMGSAHQPIALLLVVGIGMAVTSVPVVSKIFHDLGILNTRFARLVLGVAVVEDILLWAVLAVATTLAKSNSLPPSQIAVDVAVAATYFAVGLAVMPRLLRRVSAAKWNFLIQASPVGYLVSILLAYCAVAALLHVSLAFAGFLAGYAAGSQGNCSEEALTPIAKVAFGVFVPVYFAVVGYQLDLTRSFSMPIFAVFLATTCVAKMLSTGLGARLAKFPWADSLNLSLVLNARGGPGIVLASIALDAGIINSVFYTTLVLVAVLTSQLAGAWIDRVLQRGWPLLSEQASIPPKMRRNTDLGARSSVAKAPGDQLVR
jgi:Kef-type K+ transport system membrane component KefB